VIRPARTTANEVSPWSVQRPSGMKWRTRQPRISSASASRRRWQRHHCASAHIIAVGARFAASSSRARPAANSAVAVQSA